MKTFIAENVLEDYSSGLIVVKAQSRKKAIEIIKNTFKNHGFIVDCGDVEDCKSVVAYLKIKRTESNGNQLFLCPQYRGES